MIKEVVLPAVRNTVVGTGQNIVNAGRFVENNTTYMKYIIGGVVTIGLMMYSDKIVSLIGSSYKSIKEELKTGLKR
jgi:hypothetical protein